MSITLQEFGLDRLNSQERLDLISIIWDSIPDSIESLPLPQWHREELERRLKACDDNPNAGILWEEAKTLLRKRT